MMNITMKRQAGLSLVEVMVAVAVGSLLSLGLIDVLINSSQAYRTQNALMRVQEEGQFATDTLVKDIRDTNFWGCLTDLGKITNHLNTLGTGYSATYMGFTSALSGQSNVSGGSFVTGSDTITISAADNIGGGAQVQSPYGSGVSSPITIPTNSGVTAGDIVLVSDCLQGDIFQVTNSDANTTGSLEHAASVGSPGNSNSSLSKVYGAGAFVLLPYTRTYSIRTNAEGNPGLYMTDSTGTQEIAEGIENMVILYGEDTNNDGTANQYVRAASVTDMDEVVSIRLNLLVQSLENNVTDRATSYVFNGQTITPTDRRLRRVYSTTVVLRNRVGS